ncbi:probable RNA-binding protein CG14230 [Ceratina calcarata]|uniref:Probable RNA-binding protein CG14230 n=1 Tax=Ceratina calcarata TaxID=156304 RepID=A0AAJ7IXN7_9HYME|nr:probable RNA-binding protein CG14230 [Ceratina calcarata]
MRNMVMLNNENYDDIKMDRVNASEKKRLESLKRQKEIFRTKELAVKNALKNLDSTSNKNKIIFSDDNDQVKQPRPGKKEKKRKRDLFNNDDDQPLWNDDQFAIDRHATGKALSTVTLGNDDRFKLDERFVENDKSVKNNLVENNDENDLQKEKELQLDILENILGAPITSRNKIVDKDAKFTKKGMIRYDPTKSSHKEYEINTEKSETESKTVKKRKKTKNTEDKNVDPTIPVSTDVYFSVSDSLTKSLNEGGQFSLLKTYGKETDEKGEDNENAQIIEAPKRPNFQFDFKSKNPFKYDSSDDERDAKQEYTVSEERTDDIIEQTNNFFFEPNDVRFNEAESFFSKDYASEDKFKELRQELKQIVRLKIRRNLKKKQPWGYKKKVKRAS